MKFHIELVALILWFFTVQASDLPEVIRREREVAKLLDTSDVDEGRAFFNFDRGNAFNTSVAFTIPLFSFTLPGAQDSIDSGLDDGNTFGILAFVALFLIGGLGVAIYTTSQGGNEDSQFTKRSYIDNSIMMNVLDALEGVDEAFGVESCAQLGVCEAHANPSEYGWLGLPLRLIFPASDSRKNETRSAYSRAANFGISGQDECYYEYPCLIHPLDTAVYISHYAKRNILKLLR